MPSFRRPGLRGRFVLANLVMVSALVATLAALAAHLFESYEVHSLAAQVAADVDRLAAYREAPPVGGNLDFGGSRGIVVREEEAGALPPTLRALTVGVHEDVELDGHEYFIGRRDAGGYRYYVLLDAGPFEAMEATLMRYAAYGLLAGAVVAILLSLWMSGQVLRPVRDLSERLARIRPGTPRDPFVVRYGDEHLDRMAATFESHLDRLEEFVAREQALTEDVSHELRTPLSVARSAVTLLLEAPDLPPLTRQRVERIARATRQMEELVEAILFLAREDGGGSGATVALEALVREVVESRQEAAQRAGAAIHVLCEASETVVAHPGMVMSIVGNVLDNAIRHGGGGEVVVHLARGRLTVTDRGPGIAPDRLDAVFSRKARGAGSRGYGLGLHIVRGLCERLGWRISLASPPAGGTCVVLEYPPV